MAFTIGDPEIVAARSDADLTSRLTRLIERDREILDRLAGRTIPDAGVDDVVERFGPALRRVAGDAESRPGV